MDWFEAFILGLIQGLTEFLPISSSGHLEIGKYLFGIDTESSFVFNITLHGATVLSTIVIFWREILGLFKGLFKFQKNEETSYVFKLVVSMIPIGIVGIFFNDYIEAFFDGNILFIGFMLLVTALLLCLAHFTRKGDRQITYLDAFIIGISQAIATIPGLSRSGTTIATGLLIGNDKSSLAKFSFLMVIIPIIGANFLELINSDIVYDGGTISIASLVVGFLSAFISGLFACKWMINLVRKSKLIWFSLYCLFAGTLAILLGI